MHHLNRSRTEIYNHLERFRHLTNPTHLHNKSPEETRNKRKLKPNFVLNLGKNESIYSKIQLTAFEEHLYSVHPDDNCGYRQTWAWGAL